MNIELQISMLENEVRLLAGLKTRDEVAVHIGALSSRAGQLREQSRDDSALQMRVNRLDRRIQEIGESMNMRGA